MFTFSCVAINKLHIESHCLHAETGTFWIITDISKRHSVNFILKHENIEYIYGHTYFFTIIQKQHGDSYPAEELIFY